MPEQAPAARRWARVAVFAAWTAFILWATLETDVSHTASFGWAFRLARWLGLPDKTLPKTFHFGSYGVWVWLLAGIAASGYLRPLGARRAVMCAASLGAMSAFQESLQFLNPARTPALFDFCLNIAGGLLSLAARPLTMRARRQRATERMD